MFTTGAHESIRGRKRSEQDGDAETTTSRQDSTSLKKKKRLMRSTGHNIINTGVEGKNWKYFTDLYTTLLDIKWRWNILIFVGVFNLTWVIFAGVYYLETYLHGDLDRAVSTPCLQNVETFTGAFLFSIETMTTIGYGYRSQTEECPGVYLAVLIQSILGAGLQFALASLVVSKTRRAKRRSETILFSNNVCICEQDGCLQLTVRIGDMRTSEIVGAHVKGYLIMKLRSGDGTMVPIRSFPLTFQAESGRNEIFFPWPTQVLHTVDEESPLWPLSRDDFRSGKYELIVVLDGICGSTSTAFQARKSYHTNELKWGHRFSTMNMAFEDSSYVMDLSNFHHTVPASTPLCSAQDINSLRMFYASKYSHMDYNTPSERRYRKCTTRGETRHGTTRGGIGNDAAGGEIRHDATGEGITHDATGGEITQDATGGEIRLADQFELEPSSDEPLRSARQTHRSESLEERRRNDGGEPKAARRCSLGNMIRLTQGKENDNDCYLGDAKNIYRHRKSITDTYLGTDIEEIDDDSDYQAIMTVISQRSTERRTDVRDIFKKRRNSVSRLFFEHKLESSENEYLDGMVDTTTRCNYSYDNNIASE